MNMALLVKLFKILFKYIKNMAKYHFYAGRLGHLWFHKQTNQPLLGLGDL